MGFGDFTWKKPARRTPPGAGILPAHIKPCPHAVFIIDTSGSMDSRDLSYALGVVAQGLRGLANPRGLRVLAGDRHVRQAQTLFRPEQIQLVGGGGTEMATLIVEAAKERPKPNVILTITDGETDWPSHRLDVPVLACLTRATPSCPVQGWIQKVVLVPTSRAE